MQCLTWPMALAKNQLRLRLVLIITPRLCMLLTIPNQSSFNNYLKNAYQSPWICREMRWSHCPQAHLKLKTRQDANRQRSTGISLGWYLGNSPPHIAGHVRCPPLSQFGETDARVSPDGPSRNFMQGPQIITT